MTNEQSTSLPRYFSATSSFKHSAMSSLGFWIFVTTLVNIVIATGDGYGGDIGYWVDWTRHLQNRGYADFPANYPPIYIHWLWLMGKFYSQIETKPVLDHLIHFLSTAPALCAHIGLLVLVNRVRDQSQNDISRNLLLGFVALNPALLINGPYWGQVDLVFSCLVAWAIYLLVNDKKLTWVIPILTLAVLTKFQTIFAAPIIAALFWHRRSHALFSGFLPAFIITVLVLFPYWHAGSLELMFRQAYLNAASSYPVASLNADNLWFLLGLNEVSDAVFLFDHNIAAQGWRTLFTAKIAGKTLFLVWSIALLVSSLRRDDVVVHWRNAILCACGFFAFLPSMHERYIFPAVVMALLACAVDRKFLIHSIGLTTLAGLNMLFIVGFHGGLLPYALSAILLAWTSSLFVGEENIKRITNYATSTADARLWLVAAAALWCISLAIHVTRVMPRNGQMDATTISGRSVQQDWGPFMVDASVAGQPLTVDGKKYPRGFGTHARSSINIPIPDKAKYFETEAGLDDESRGGEVQFKILIDDKLVWQSDNQRNGPPVRAERIAVYGKSRITLFVDPLKDNSNDHADWLNPRFLFQ